MFLTVQVLILIISVVIILTKVFWEKFSYDNLTSITKYIVWSLPFELIPSLQIAGVSVRISQLLVILGFYVIVILAFKKDKQLLNQKINSLSFLPLLFLVVELPSWLNIYDFKRFLTYHIATFLVFGAFFLVTNFVRNPIKRLQELSYILAACSVFGWYQLIGDYIGLPTNLTGLREQYTKQVFGIARIQGTAIEPLHFAGMLMIGLIFETQQFLGSWHDKLHDLRFRIARIALFLVTIIFTFSKGTWGILFIITLISIVWGLYKFFNQSKIKFIFSPKKITTGIISLIVLVFGVISISQIPPFSNITANILETIDGKSPSSVERQNFVNNALRILPENSVLGIGMGQFGPKINSDLGLINKDDSAIVNNTYLEVWLENGLLALITLIIILVIPLFSLFKSKNNLNFGLAMILVAFYLEWYLISPIFIMPIWIILGLCYARVVYPKLI